MNEASLLAKDALHIEIERNYDFFQRSLARLLLDHAGEFALIKGKKFVGFYADPFDADIAGTAHFPDKLYSIQQVTDEPVELGIYANAPD
jgi:hypothetical protein